MSTQTQSETPADEALAEAQHRSIATKLFLGMLVGVSLLYGIVLTYHVSNPLVADNEPELHWLEQCRQLCAKYGLVSTGNLKNDAEAYLELVDSKKLSAPLEELLSDTSFERAPPEEHPLLGKPAPDFTLINTQNQDVSLGDLQQQGPVIVVFYYGYNCSHCVAQLFALQKDLEYFRELGVEIVAISADTPDHTREKYAEFGGFTFPVLTDPEYKVAEQWGVYSPATEDAPEDLLHGTFVIDGSGNVVFANRGYQPFVDNKSLLHWVAPSRPDDELPSHAEAANSATR